MVLQINKKTLALVLVLVGALVGTGLVWTYENYKDNVSDFIRGPKDDGNDDNIIYEELVEDGTPYSAPATWNVGLVYDDVKEVRFWIFQPKVAEYKTVDGVNYLVGEYTFEDGLDAQMHKVDIVLSRESEWTMSAEGLSRSAFEGAVGSDVQMEKSFHPADTDEYLVEETLSLEDFKKKFPVGQRIAVKVPLYYPVKDERTKAACGVFENACDYANVWDVLSKELEEFNTGGVVSEEFILVPTSFSDSVYVFGEE